MTSNCHKGGVQENFAAGHVCWDDQDIIRGRPTGAVRFSFGYASACRDVGALLSFVKQHFVEHARPDNLSNPPMQSGEQPFLAGIWVYPIKSCRSCKVEEWHLGENGLLYDREWALVGEDGEVLTLKKNPQLALIQPSLDLTTGLLLKPFASFSGGKFKT